jgi:phospholipase C
MARKRVFSLLVAVLALAGVTAVAVAQAESSGHSRPSVRPQVASPSQATVAYQTSPSTKTPIKHVVVIFDENISFDHYFGTYPHATNPAGEPPFHAAPGTPTVNGLSPALLTHNPNSANPQRLDRSQAVTCDQNHGYKAEQSAYDHGLMDQFVQDTAGSGCTDKSIVMDYYDGNTVTALWNLAQHFSLNDNSYSDTFGPSTPGAINVISGNTYGVICGPSSSTINAPTCPTTPPGSTPAKPDQPQPQGPGTNYSDSDPYYDVCSDTEDGNTSGASTIEMGGKNIGDLLDEAGITWGWFQGGFASPNYVSGKPSTDDLSAVCTTTHDNVAGASANDYSVHHEPFQYYASTANPQHLPPTSIAMIGHQDQANHQYDLRDFWAAADNHNLPAVSYLKAPEYQDGHAGYSDPIDEQTWIASTIDHLESLPSWSSTAVVIAYDDSDGWYDHQAAPVINQSQVASIDALSGAGQCGTNTADVPDGQQGRCGPGMRQPLLVISPYSRVNYVDSAMTTQSSIVQFIEDNWLGGESVGGGSDDATAGSLDGMFNFRRPDARPLFLNPSTGEQVGGWGGWNSWTAHSKNK